MADVLCCDRCGGEGFIEYKEAPEVWGDDFPAEVNHLVVCPLCEGLSAESTTDEDDDDG